MSEHQEVLRDFSTCPLCGSFLASLLALLGEKSLEKALENDPGNWLQFPWHPAMAEMLASYFDWDFIPGMEENRGRCSSCLRRISYLYDTSGDVEPAEILQLERRPGSRV